MRLSKVGTKYVLESTFAERAVPKDARFRWDPAAKHWWTDDAARAAKLADVAVGEAADILKPLAAKHAEALVASRATDADVAIPMPEGINLFPYQRAGVAFAAQHPNVLIGDEMGLGKTPQAIALVNLDLTIKRALIIVPASLKLNWLREWARFSTRTDLTIAIGGAKEFPSTDVVIINRDVLHKWTKELTAAEWDIVIGDEVHGFKNAKARRSKCFYAIPARRRVYLTGTPLVNRPIELFPIVNSLDPATFSNFFGFAKRYCNAHKDMIRTRGGYKEVWNFNGASNLHELQELLRTTVMIRRLKADVLTELPAKTRQIVELSENGSAAILKAERKALDGIRDELRKLAAAARKAKKDGDDAKYADAVTALRNAARYGFTELSKVRHETALAKVPHVIEHLEDAIDETKVIVFAHHVDVIEQIAAAFGERGRMIHGGTSLPNRQKAVDDFQGDDTVRVIVCSIQAAGVGLTLTASSTVVFAELDWVPGNVSQAEDRAHRIGQTNPVLIQHLVFDGSIDSKLAKTIIAKQRVIDAALDGTAPPKPVNALTEVLGEEFNDVIVDVGEVAPF